MTQNNLTFTLNLEGNLQDNLQRSIKGVANLNGEFSKAQTFLERIRDKAVAFNQLSDFVGKIGQAFSSINAAGMTSELQKMNMTTLFQGNAEAAEDMYARISHYGKVTPYDKAGLIDAQKTMMSFGIEGEKSFKVLKQIGDIAMGDAAKMQSLSLAFAQMSSSGKLNGQDLMQMINAGFNPLNEIARKTGKSMATLKEEMSKGAISVSMVEEAFAAATSQGGLFYQAIDKASQTSAAKMASIKDSIEEVKIKIFELAKTPLLYLQTLSQVTAEITPLLSLLPIINSGIRKLSTHIGNTRLQMALLKMEVRTAGGWFTAMGKLGAAACKMISKAIMSIPIIGWIAAGITAVVAAVTLLWQKCEGFRVVVMGVWQVIKDGAVAIWNVVRGLFTGVGAGIGWLWDAVTNTIDSIMSDVRTLFAWIRNAAHSIHTWLNNTIFAPIVHWFENLWTNTIRPLLDKVIAKLGAVFRPIIDLWNKVTGKVVSSYATGAAKGHANWASDHTSSIGTNAALINAVSGGQQAGTLDAGSQTAQSTETVATGGRRSTNVYIHLKDLVGTINFQGTLAEKREDMERSVAEAMFRVLNMAQSSIS